MKIAVLSDIHGHLPALEAVIEHVEKWQPDVVMVNGDVVNRGPKSGECWQVVKQKQKEAGWLVTRGNHEDYITQYLGEADDVHQLSFWTFQKLGVEIAQELAQLPLTVSVSHPAGGEVRAVHASMLGTRYGIWHHSPEDEVQKQIHPAPAVVCTGHVHFPFLRPLPNTLIVNSGSVGTVCDHGDLRATYAQIEWRTGRWSASIQRVPYDIAQTERDYRESGILEEAGGIAQLIYEEWRTGWPVISYWSKNPKWAEREKEAGTNQSATEFLAQFDLEKLKPIAIQFYQKYQLPNLDVYEPALS